MLLPLIPILLAGLLGGQPTLPPPLGGSESLPRTKPTTLPLARGLMAQYVKAIGGRVAFWDLESFSAHATMEISGSENTGELELTFRRPDLMKIRLALGKLGTSEVGADGQNAWEISDTIEGDFVEIISLQDAHRRRRDLNWFELAIRLKEGSRVFKTVAPSDFNGHPCWEIQKITRRGAEERIFIDRENYLLRGIRMMESGPSGEFELTLSFLDWKRVGPLLLFHEMVIAREEMKLTVRFDRISLDTVPPDTFLPPPRVRELLLKEQDDGNHGTLVEPRPSEDNP